MIQTSRITAYSDTTRTIDAQCMAFSTPARRVRKQAIRRVSASIFGIYFITTTTPQVSD